MFKDYYDILKIEYSSTPKEIKLAFKKQALKWHPDKNRGVDTTTKMQDINEAKLILLDDEARARYDIEYRKFKEFKEKKESTKKNETKKDKEEDKKEPKPKQQTENYNVEDETLNKWMNNAKKQAVDLAKETIQDLRGMTQVGLQAGSEKIGSQIPALLIVAFFCLIIVISLKTCNT
ncbi:MAG: DnaJ domain-containing protein [Flavobacteriales bacterium]|nr:DnaJ domain-containing protein [Flavobacteriales bacterium]